jgi:flagellar biogenesis protein FliO
MKNTFLFLKVISKLFLITYFFIFSNLALSQEPQSPTPSFAEKMERAKQIVDSANAKQDEAIADVSEPDLTGAGVKLIQNLGILIGILLIGTWAAKKWLIKELPESVRNLKIIDRITIDPRNRLTLVEVSGKQVLVGHGNGNIALLEIGSNEIKNPKSFDVSLVEAIKE